MENTSLHNKIKELLTPAPLLTFRHAVTGKVIQAYSRPDGPWILVGVKTQAVGQS